MSPEELDKHHERIKATALGLFSETRKMGGDEFSQPYCDRLMADLDETYEQYLKHNDSKNLFNVARTPITLVITMTIMYILSGVFGLVGLYSMANFANMVLGLTLVFLTTWTYIRYSGKYSECAVYIDSAAEFIWVQVGSSSPM